MKNSCRTLPRATSKRSGRSYVATSAMPGIRHEGCSQCPDFRDEDGDGVCDTRVTCDKHTGAGCMTEAIREFNPEGELGPRHLHTLPNRVIPVFEGRNADHLEVRRLAEILSQSTLPLIAADPNIADPAKPIASRRRRLRSALKELPAFGALEDVAAAVLGR